MDSNSKKKKNTTAMQEMGVFIIMGCFLLLFLYTFLVAGSERVLIEQYQISSPINIEAHDVGTRLENQIITFDDENGETVVIEYAIFDGSTDAEELYVYRIGKWKWLSELSIKQYYVTDREVQEQE